MLCLDQAFSLQAVSSQGIFSVSTELLLFYQNYATLLKSAGNTLSSSTLLFLNMKNSCCCAGKLAESIPRCGAQGSLSRWLRNVVPMVDGPNCWLCHTMAEYSYSLSSELINSITGWFCLEGPSGSIWSNLCSPRAGCPGPRSNDFGRSSRRDSATSLSNLHHCSATHTAQHCCLMLKKNLLCSSCAH